MSHPLDAILQAQKRGEPVGIPSICSAHPWVLKTALQGNAPVLIETTCNQVNQDGGYTGMTPQDFVAYVRRMASETHFPVEKLILGGDHLGPFPWQDLPAEAAMARAEEMVQAYVLAGYTKIHLDASMSLGDDDQVGSSDIKVSAYRTARLARAAEECFGKLRNPSQEIRYVVGTEVPVPGGAAGHEDRVHVTGIEDARRTLESLQAAFVEQHLEHAWQRVQALVVQPGVEFGDDFVLEYDPAAARSLSGFIDTTPFVFEAHSTDYQSPDSLRALVGDHFAILKVGPALTNAFREAVFSLAAIERELVTCADLSGVVETLEAVMLAEPKHWLHYYHGSRQAQTVARRYSLSDRIRYYWPHPAVQRSLDRLLANLAGVNIPMSLISQYFPDLFLDVRSRKLSGTPGDLIKGKIQAILQSYSIACGC